MTVMPSDVHRSVKRVLIYRLGSLGDTVIALPAFHLIAQAFPDAERRLLTSFPPNAKAPASSAILEHTGLVHGFFRYTLRTRSVGELIRLWWQLLRWRPEVLVYLNPGSGVRDAKRNAMFFRLCGIPRLIGIPVRQDMQLCRPEVNGANKSVSGVTYEHEITRLTRNISALGDARLEVSANWDLHLTAAEKARADEVLKPLAGTPFIAVSFGTKNQSNEWGEENWNAFLSRLTEMYPAYALVICGAAVEADLSELASSGWRKRSSAPVLNLCGVLSPRESAAVFSRAVIFLGQDSGPMHLAAAVQTPCIGVYSSRNLPGIWFPYGDQHRILYHHVDCEDCGLQTCVVQKKKCILSITVDEVLAQVVAVLPMSNR